MKIVTLLFFVIWLIHLSLGVGAGFAALRLWHSRHITLIKWTWFYINAFIVDVLSAIVLLFMAKSVTLTWKFTAVMFISTFISDLFRAPLIFYLIKGPAKASLPMPHESGEKMEAFRQVMREELQRDRT